MAGALLAATLAADTAAARRAPCAEGAKRPLCTFTDARAVFIADGDTIRVRLAGRIRTVRFTGLNAMELTRYSKYPGRRRGAVTSGLAGASSPVTHTKATTTMDTSPRLEHTRLIGVCIQPYVPTNEILPALCSRRRIAFHPGSPIQKSSPRIQSRHSTEDIEPAVLQVCCRETNAICNLSRVL